MRKILTGGIVLLILLASAVAFAGLRIVIVPPANGKAGKTLVAAGLNELRVIDSPDAYCRRQGDEDPTCPISFSLAIAREGTLLVELPYIQALRGMADAPGR